MGRWMAVSVGFVGVVIACRPGFSASGPFLLALCAAALWSISTILIRLTRLSPAVPRGLGAAARACPPRVRSSIPGIRSLAPRLGLHHRATRVHEPLWAFVIQFTVWGNIPDGFVMLGALLIGCSGLVDRIDRVERVDANQARAAR